MRCCFVERLVLQALTPTPDSQGGRSTVPTTVATVWAELVEGAAQTERLQATNMGATTDYRFRIRARADVVPTLIAEWTPRWPPGSPTLPLEIHGVVREANQRTLLLECGVRD